MSETREAGSIVEELVHQFTDPFAFYRELIQNSIDAGSSRIEVTLSFRPGAEKGLCLASVADWGEGMNRDVIENYLVTKFRSTKENDLTKIGKFGIGFVSIFACKPDAVSVDTGRDGEFWRVLFRKDLTYELLKLSEPLEGTRVTLHKELTAADYDDFVARSLASVKRWCRHSEVDVVFSAGDAAGNAAPTPTPVREQLAVDAPFQVEHVEDGTHIVAGPSRVAPAPTGLYNRGLTLLDTNEVLVPGVALKIVSRYLEHTLTRDNVRRDRHFKRAMELANQLVKTKLLPQLPLELRAAAEHPARANDWAVLFEFARERLKPKEVPLRLTGGGAATRDDVVRAMGTQLELIVSPGPTPLVDRLRAAKFPVLELSAGTELCNTVAQWLRARSVAVADDRFTYAAPPDAPEPPEFSSALATLLVRAGAKVKKACVAEVRGAGREAPFVLLDALGQPVRLEDARLPPFAKGAPPLLCLNLAHEAIAAAAPLFSRAPRLAAVLMARLVLARCSRLDEERDRALTEWALA